MKYLIYPIAILQLCSITYKEVSTYYEESNEFYVYQDDSSGGLEYPGALERDHDFALILGLFLFMNNEAKEKVKNTEMFQVFEILSVGCC